MGKQIIFIAALTQGEKGVALGARVLMTESPHQSVLAPSPFSYRLKLGRLASCIA